ncbi:peptidase [Achlya hypogyna]|uniref:Peptidase n=1 Tax=Achlya hypogyna TaxID=1202772 RepID=A0A1V9Z1A0_ACHHY|nr:peptidase [Achlya hypogyna]
MVRATVKCLATLAAIVAVEACTVISVGKKATVDGSVLVSHTNDAGLNPADLRMVRVPAMNHSEGSLRPIYNFQRNGFPRLVSNDRGPLYAPTANESLSIPLGHIPQVPYTFGYFDHDYGMINDQQLSIAESTCAAKTVGWPSSLHYGHNLFQIEELSKIALERCDSARCAIRLMGDLAVEHGFFGEYGKNQKANYGSSSEALGISDKYGESWILHMLTGPNNASAVWAAQRVPDEHVAVVANSFVIRTLNLSDPDNYMASSNVMSFAREMGWWDPSSGPFDFAAAYSWAKPGPSKPLYGGRRIWRVFDVFAPSLNLDATLGQHPEVETYPFSVKPDKLLAPRDLMEMMRDHYEGTPFDMTKDVAAGPFGNPVRFGGSTKNVAGGWERSISMHRTTHSFVLQARGNMPDDVGGVTWYSLAAPHGSVYAPFSCAQGSIPDSYLASRKHEFSTQSAWWAFEFVNNWSMLRYDMIHADVAVVLAELQDAAIALESTTRAAALQMPDAAARTAFIETKYNAFAQAMVDRWWQLAFKLIAKFSDGYVVHGDRAGDMHAPGYPAWWLQSTNFASWPAQDAYKPPAKILAMQAPPRSAMALWVISGIVAVAAMAVIGIVFIRQHRRSHQYRRLE